MWVPFRRFKVREHERGLLFKDREFQGILRPGRHFVWDPLWNVRADVLSVRDVWLDHRDLDVIVRSGALEGEGKVVDLKDHERAVVWVDGRLEAVLKPGLYAPWTARRRRRSLEPVERGSHSFPRTVGRSGSGPAST